MTIHNESSQSFVTMWENMNDITGWIADYDVVPGYKQVTYALRNGEKHLFIILLRKSIGFNPDRNGSPQAESDTTRNKKPGDRTKPPGYLGTI